MKAITLSDLTRHYSKASGRLQKPYGDVFGLDKMKTTAMRDVKARPAAPPAVSFPVFKLRT